MSTLNEEMKAVLDNTEGQPKPVRTINLEPTWEACAEIYLRCVEAGDTWTARQNARKEILRMGRLLDQLIEQDKLRGTDK